ncbi:hypothetical protein DVH24_003633 [Malus domestica]|uniref:Uncharacterized protein n=1 Tax=Malus domestica TaxID=3750 RepID=A0A498ILW4_MALDO|nr:hypothetical protein DVH24_003633 [Malus domestica]
MKRFVSETLQHIRVNLSFISREDGISSAEKPFHICRVLENLFIDGDLLNKKREVVLKVKSNTLKRNTSADYGELELNFEVNHSNRALELLQALSNVKSLSLSGGTKGISVPIEDYCTRRKDRPLNAWCLAFKKSRFGGSKVSGKYEREMMSSVEQTTKKGHAVFVPYPAQGHVNPMMQLAKFLHSRGFHITFVNTEFNHNRLIRSKGPDSVKGLPDFVFETIPDGLPPSDKDGTQDIPALCDSIKKTCFGPFKELVAKIISSSQVPQVTCIVADGVMTFGCKAARELGIPEVVLWTASACGFMGYLQYNELVKRGMIPFKDGISSAEKPFHICRVLEILFIEGDLLNKKREVVLKYKIAAELEVLDHAKICIRNTSADYGELELNFEVNHSNRALELLQALSNVKSLSLSGGTKGAVSYSHGTLDNVEEIALRIRPVEKFREISKDFRAHRGLLYKTPEGSTPKCLVLGLQEIEIWGFEGALYELTVVEFLLAHAQVLRKITVHVQ